jgi:hypothetical protein
MCVVPPTKRVSSSIDRTQPLTPNPRDTDLRILVPIVRAQAAATLIAVGDALAKHRDAEGKVLGLVEIRGHPDPNMTGQVAHRRRDLLKWIADQEIARGSSGHLGILVRVVHNVAMGIREAVYETASNMVVIEWPGPGSPRAGTLASMLDNLSASPPADLVLVRPAQRKLPIAGDAVRVVVPVRGGLNARLALRVASAVTDAWGGEMSLLHLINSDDHPDRQSHDLERARSTASTLPLASLIEQHTADVGSAIVSAAAHADVVVLGAYSEKGRHPAAVRPELADALSSVEGLLIVVRSARLEVDSAGEAIRP